LGLADNQVVLVNCYMRDIIFKILIAGFILVGLGSCGALEDGAQFSNKVTANAFVAELYGNITQTITINHATDSHVSWIGFVQANDYQYFKVTKVQTGDTVIVSDGVEVDGVTYVANSNALIEDVSVGTSSGGSDEFVNGSINVAGQGSLKITVEYSPLVAINDDDEPHEAYLILYYDAPSMGTLRVKLQGYTDGMKNEKCARAVSTMTPSVYKFKNNKFDFYFCGEEVAAKGQNNIADLAETDPGYHGESTNLTEVSTLDVAGQEQYLTVYQVDEETLCLLSGELTGTDPSIPDFTFIVPEGLAPIDQLEIKTTAGSFAECSVDADGLIFCDSTLMVDTGVVPVSELTATNGTISAEELVTSQCSDFGALSGSGAYGTSDLTLVMKGTMLSDANTQSFNIVDALVAAEIELECVSGC